MSAPNQPLIGLLGFVPYLSLKLAHQVRHESFTRFTWNFVCVVAWKTGSPASVRARAMCSTSSPHFDITGVCDVLFDRPHDHSDLHVRIPQPYLLHELVRVFGMLGSDARSSYMHNTVICSSAVHVNRRAMFLRFDCFTKFSVFYNV